MKLGIFARTFRGTMPAEVLSAARRAGYDAVQYNMMCSGLGSLPAFIDEDAATAVRAASLATDVEVVAVSATYNMIHPDPAERERGRRGFAAIAGAAHTMGTRLLTVCSGTRDPDDQWRHHPDNASSAAWNDARQEFERLLEIAGRHDVLIGVEPEAANVVSSAERARALIDDLGSDRIRVVLDPANLVDVTRPERQVATMGEVVDLLWDRIALVHAKDRRADGTVVAAGRGVIDFRRLLGMLRRAGFDGPVVTHGLTADEAKEAAAFLRSILTAAG